MSTTQGIKTQGKTEIEPRCDLCGDNAIARCSHCESQGLLVELAWDLSAASEKAMAAYKVHPNGAWGSMVARLKTRLVELTNDVAKEAGVIQ